MSDRSKSKEWTIKHCFPHAMANSDSQSKQYGHAIRIEGVREVSDEAEGAAVLQMTNNALSEMLKSLEVRE